jgi:hypothetical protein
MSVLIWRLRFWQGHRANVNETATHNTPARISRQKQLRMPTTTYLHGVMTYYSYEKRKIALALASVPQTFLDLVTIRLGSSSKPSRTKMKFTNALFFLLATSASTNAFAPVRKLLASEIHNYGAC